MCVCVCVCLSVCLSVCLPTCLFISPVHLPLSFRPPTPCHTMPTATAIALACCSMPCTPITTPHTSQHTTPYTTQKNRTRTHILYIVSLFLFLRNRASVDDCLNHPWIQVTITNYVKIKPQHANSFIQIRPYLSFAH